MMWFGLHDEFYERGFAETGWQWVWQEDGAALNLNQPNCWLQGTTPESDGSRDFVSWRLTLDNPALTNTVAWSHCRPGSYWSVLHGHEELPYACHVVAPPPLPPAPFGGYSPPPPSPLPPPSLLPPPSPPPPSPPPYPPVPPEAPPPPPPDFGGRHRQRPNVPPRLRRKPQGCKLLRRQRSHRLRHTRNDRNAVHPRPFCRDVDLRSASLCARRLRHGMQQSAQRPHYRVHDRKLVVTNFHAVQQLHRRTVGGRTGAHARLRSGSRHGHSLDRRLCNRPPRAGRAESDQTGAPPAPRGAAQIVSSASSGARLDRRQPSRRRLALPADHWRPRPGGHARREPRLRGEPRAQRDRRRGPRRPLGAPSAAAAAARGRHGRARHALCAAGGTAPLERDGAAPDAQPRRLGFARALRGHRAGGLHARRRLALVPRARALRRHVRRLPRAGARQRHQRQRGRARGRARRGGELAGAREATRDVVQCVTSVACLDQVAEAVAVHRGASVALSGSQRLEWVAKPTPSSSPRSPSVPQATEAAPRWRAPLRRSSGTPSRSARRACHAETRRRASRRCCRRGRGAGRRRSAARRGRCRVAARAAHRARRDDARADERDVHVPRGAHHGRHALARGGARAVAAHGGGRQRRARDARLGLRRLPVPRPAAGLPVALCAHRAAA